MGKFAELVAKSHEQERLSIKASKTLCNKLVDEVSRIFMNPNNYKSLVRMTYCTWSFVLKDEKDVEKYISLIEKLNINCILFESGVMYKNKNTYGSRTFTIESSEKDIDLIFEQIKVAFEKLKR